MAQPAIAARNEHLNATGVLHFGFLEWMRGRSDMYSNIVRAIPRSCTALFGSAFSGVCMLAVFATLHAPLASVVSCSP